VSLNLTVDFATEGQSTREIHAGLLSHWLVVNTVFGDRRFQAMAANGRSHATGRCQGQPGRGLKAHSTLGPNGSDVYVRTHEWASAGWLKVDRVGRWRC